jgi:hypothetical protein
MFIPDAAKSQVNHMPKKMMKQATKHVPETAQDRETKILNIMANTSILLMSLMTDAFSGAFAGMAAGMAQAVTEGLGAEKEPANMKKIEQVKTEIPKQMIAQIVQMKADMKGQLRAKKEEIEKTIADPRFDAGITIAEQYDFGVPNLTHDLDERSLLKYIALLKANDARCTKMFQELMEWMKSLPQPS